MRNWITAACAAAALCLATNARAAWTLSDASMTEQPGLTVNTWSVTEGLSASGATGAAQKIPTRNVVRLVSDAKPTTAVHADGTWQLLLRNGDILLGTPDSMPGQSLRFTVAGFGNIDVPLTSVSSLSVYKAGAVDRLGSGGEKDVVQLMNGDRVEGLVASVDGKTVQISAGAEGADPTPIALNLVRRISFAGATPPRTIPPLSVRLSFNNGNILTVPVNAKVDAFNWSVNDVTFTDPAGNPQKVAASDLQSVEVLGGRAVYLTEIDPDKEDQVTLFGNALPAQMNRNVVGGPINVANQLVQRGIGVHTGSTLAFTLDGSFQTLRFQVGMDQSATPYGSADVSVSVDGKSVWHKDRMIPVSSAAAADDAAKLNEWQSVPVNGAKHLELSAQPPKDAQGVNILGRVDWANVVLIRD